MSYLLRTGRHLARDVRGIDSRSADAIAEKLGVEKTAPQRLRAGVSFALQTAMDEGHCGLPIETLVGLAERLLDVDATRQRAPRVGGQEHQIR